ncbi:universal stress protein [Kitasatospora cineracea]|uniref:universal stress protein n=1 Tax=Kitasatospora cineracea TaxID=88074 RepID=UPI00341DD1FD
MAQEPRLQEPRVVVGVDGSPGSLAALRRAVPEAAARGAVLVPLLAGCPSDAAARRLLDAALRHAVGGWPGGVVVRPVVAPGPAGPALVAAVGGPEDLLLLGTDRHRHHHGLPHLRGARTEHHCRTHSRCPVLTVPADPPVPYPGPPTGPRTPVRAA